MLIHSDDNILLRHITLGDADFILDLYNQPAFKRFIGDRGVNDLQSAKDFITKTQGHYQQHGFWLYLVEDKTSGESLGVNGLVQRPYLNAPDIGFAISEQYWGQGFAYESSLAVLEHAKTLHLPEVLAITSPDNSSSVNLLVKLGFSDQGIQLIPDTNEEVTLYRHTLT
ncbi:GNAT family N-acetyltransferase [Kangiella marina]|uniref:GNAT family N-acetyltransferase n=1 Tax=Kangiella marina TaxID=1079178 RepID=A0ABP8IIK0_9GAMM